MFFSLLPTTLRSALQTCQVFCTSNNSKFCQIKQLLSITDGPISESSKFSAYSILSHGRNLKEVNMKEIYSNET